MKIKINENESYELKINEGIYSAEEFLALLERLTGVLTTLMQQKPVADSQHQVRTETDRRILKKGEVPSHIRCPKCAGDNLNRQGFSKNHDGTRTQRWRCRKCNVSFRENLGYGSEDIRKSFPEIPRKPMTTRWDNREEVINLIKTHYFGTSEEKEIFAKSKGQDITWTHMLKCINNLKKRYNIRPEEIGLKEFPTLRNRRKAKEDIQEIKEKEDTRQGLRNLIQKIKNKEKS
jgi:rubredoxin